MNRFVFGLLFLAGCLIGGGADAWAADKLKVLIIDGQNNHNWKATTPILKDFLTNTGKFEVEVATTPANKSEPGAWQSFNPDFTKFNAVLSNYNGELWPEGVRQNFVKYVENGGGVVIVHAANNPFPQWDEFNRMIGLGWRGANYGDRVTYTADGKVQRSPKNEGPGAGHGSQHEFSIVARDREHPVMQGLPVEWKHSKDELYHGQRGPAFDMRILATAYSDKKTGGTDAHEPMIWWIPYGKGKVFTTVMGHADYSMKCIGFQAVVARGTEWVATNKVTLPLPEKFPTAEAVSAAN